MQVKRVVLGPDSPSMRACERIAREAGVVVAQACTNVDYPDGDRVTAATAYRAEWPDPRDGDVWVECGRRWHLKGRLRPPEGVVVIQSDPAAPPAAFLSASAVGRLTVALYGGEWSFTMGLWGLLDPEGMLHLFVSIGSLHAAASEAWTEAALRGECPGVEPGAFEEWRKTCTP